MNIFEMIKHDAAQLLRIAAEYVFPTEEVEDDDLDEEEEPVLQLHVTHWPIDLVEKLMRFCLEEDVDAEIGVAMLCAHALHIRTMQDIEFHDELHELLDEEAGADE